MAAFVNPYTGQVAALERALADLQKQEVPPAFTPEQMQQRQAANARQEMLGTLAQISGDKALGPVGGSLLKQAMLDRQKRVTDRGEYDPMTGQYRLHPEARQAQQEDMLARQLAAAQTNEGRALEQWNRDRERAQEQQALRSIVAAASAANRSPVGTLQYIGNTAQGVPILFNNKTGQFSQGGPGGLEPYGGPPALKREEYGKQAAAQSAQSQKIGMAENLLAKVRSTPDAFSPGKGTVEKHLVPEFAQGAMQSIMWTPDQIALRNQIFVDTAQRIHDLIGSAQTDTERKNLIGFLPQPTDPPDIIEAKISGYLDYEKEKAGMMPKIGAPAGPYQAAPPPPAPGASPARPAAPAVALPRATGRAAAPPAAPAGLPPGVTVERVR